MELTLILLGGLMTSAATMLFLFKLDIRKVLYFEAPLDVLFDIIIPMMFVGTFTGMMVSIIAGLCNSLCMFVLKHYILGYKKPYFSFKKGFYWVEVQPGKLHQHQQQGAI